MIPNLPIPSEYLHVIPSAAAGYAAFGATLAISTLAQLKLGISTGSRPPIPTVVGILSVGLASILSHHAAVVSYVHLSSSEKERVRRERKMRIFSSSAIDNESVSFGYFHVPLHTLRVCALGLITFKLLGGRFWSISPSSYTSLGSYARFSLPATEKYATQFQRKKIERLGNLFGCHTCGHRALFQIRSPVKFHADHIPPISVAKQMNSKVWRRMLQLKVKHRFYPQCVRCSNEQGGILSAATSALQNNPKLNLWKAGAGNLSCFHGNRIRLFHCAGGILAAATVYDGTDRFKYMQDQINDHVQNVVDFIDSKWK